jgi:hypothetical protein
MIRLRDLMTEVSQRAAYDFIEQNIAAIAAEFAETPRAYAGAGYWGMVYIMQSGRALKFTADSNEAALAARLKQRARSPHLISVYDVRRLNNIRLPGQTEDTQWPDAYWVIHMEEVLPLVHIRASLAAAFDIIQPYFFREQRSNEWLEKYLQDQVNTWRAISAQDAEVLRGIIAQRRTIMQDVRRFRVKWPEAHGRNVGFRLSAPDQFVIYDMQSHRGGYRGPAVSNLGKDLDLHQLITKHTTDGIDTPGAPNM